MAKPRAERIRSFLTGELSQDRAYLLPLRVFIGLGWLRAATEKIVDPGWYDGTELTAFLEQQLGWSQEAFPFYGALMEGIFLPGATALGIVVILAQLFAGVSILAGYYTNAGLLVGLVMNVNFVLAGAVDPSTFYIVIQLVLFFGGAGAVLSVDAARGAETHGPLLTAPGHDAGGRGAQHQRVYGAIAAVCLLFAVAMAPYVSTLAPATVVEDPAMILVVLALFGAGASATSAVGSREQPPRSDPLRPEGRASPPGVAT